MADKKAIHEFATGQGHSNSLFLMDNPDSLASSGYTTEKLPISDLGIVIGTLLYQQRLDTTSKTIFGGINELAAKILGITEDYDPTRTSSNPYNTGDLCFYQNVLKKCNDDDVYGTWDNTKWDDTTIADELANGGGGSGGYPVLYGTTDPTSAQGSDGQLYAKYETADNVTSVIAMWLKIQSNWCSIVIGSGGDVGIECTQAQYDAWEQAGTLLEDTNYYITDGQSGGGVVIDDTTASTTTVYSSDKVEDLLDDKQDATDNSLTTTDKTIVGAINENKSVIGYSYDEYDATTAYSTGDLCIYNNTLYKAKQATTGNLPTNTTYWEQTSIADEISELKENITPSAVSFSSNTKLTTNGVNFIKYGSFVLIIGVFRGTTITANESIWTLNNINLSSLLNTAFIPISGNVGSNYIGYIKAENDGNNIKIYSDVALDNGSLLFVNNIIPIS